MNRTDRNLTLEEFALYSEKKTKICSILDFKKENRVLLFLEQQRGVFGIDGNEIVENEQPRPRQR